MEGKCRRGRRQIADPFCPLLRVVVMRTLFERTLFKHGAAGLR
jgi:hypothetical protein